MSEEKTAESQPLARQFIEVDVRYARIVTPPELAKAYAATHAPCSSVIRVQSNAAVLAQSRRDGGLWYRFALFQYGRAILATVFVRTEGAVHVLVLDLAAAPIRELLREARTEGHLYVMLTAVDGDARLMHVADAQDLEASRRASTEAHVTTAPELAGAVAEVARACASIEGAKQLQFDIRKLRRVVMHVVLTEGHEAEIASAMQAARTVH